MPRFLREAGVQARLQVGAVDDPLEQEADEFSLAVQHDEPVLPRFMAREETAAARRMCDECAEAAVEGREDESPVLPIRRERLRADPPEDSADGSGAAGAADDAGGPLGAPLRTRLEATLGMDLGGVRVHSGPHAARAATSLAAKAFTHGGDIWLGAGQRPDDLGLIAHEVAHVVQQGGAANAPIRRAPADYRHPEDGGNVGSRMQTRISEATRDRDEEELPSDPAARAHEARGAASQVDRGELASERADIEPAARPDVDRPAAEAPRVDQARSETAAEADSPAEPLAEGEGGAEGKGEAGEEGGKGEAASAADEASALAEQAFAEAEGASKPGPEAMVMTPEPVAPVDAGGAPLPGDAEADGRIAALAGLAQNLREEGTRVRSLAVEERGNAAVLDGNIALVRGGVSMAEQGVGTSREHLATRQELATQARAALAVSEQKATTVAAEAPNYAAKADEGKADSGPMASEAGQLSAENAANTPDDPEAAAEAREQGGKMNQAGADIGTTDDAVTRTREKAGSLGEDAARAEQTNTETAARLDGNDEQLSATGEKLAEMAAQNAEARASVEALASAPDAQRQQARQLEGQGDGLVTASFDMERRLASVQRDYAQAMRAVPAEEMPEEEAREGEESQAPFEPAAQPTQATGLDGIMQRTPDESAGGAPAFEQAPESPPPAATPAATPEGPGQAQTGTLAAAEEAPGETEPLVPAGPPEAAAAEPPPDTAMTAAPAAPPEAARERVDTAGALTEALPEWMTGTGAPNAAQRDEAARAAEERRQAQIAEIEAMAGGEFQNLSAADKMGIALRMTGRNLFGSVSGIKWPGWGHLALGLIDPRGPLMGVVSGLGMMLSGGANLFSAEQWRRDPLGNLLKSAADIATGLTVILGSITALAGVIIAIMTAITILSLGTAAPVTGPVIAFCTTVLTTVGGWTIAVGKVALVLQALVFIKNLIDAACAQTATELQSETQQLTENVGDAANVVMQMGMAKAGQLGGRAAASEIRAAGGGVRYAAGMGARAGVGARAGLGAAGRGLRAAPGAALRGARALPGAALRGARALPGAALRGTRALGRGAAAVPALAVRGARGVARGVAGGARSVARGTMDLAGRGAAGLRALPGRALAGVRSLPGRIAAAPGGLVRGARRLPSRLRESFGGGMSRRFLVGEDIANLGMARSAGAEARAAVWAEARAPGGTLAAEARVAGAADEAIPPSPTEARARIDELEPSPAAQRDASVRESGSMDSADLSPRQVADELAYVDEHPGLVRGEAPNRRASVGEHEIVERPAPEMPGGVACARHSNGGLPVPCPSSLLSRNASRDAAAIEARLQELMDVPLPPELRSPAAQAMERIRAIARRQPDRADRLLAALERRLDQRGVGLPGRTLDVETEAMLSGARSTGGSTRVTAAEVETGLDDLLSVRDRRQIPMREFGEASPSGALGSSLAEEGFPMPAPGHHAHHVTPFRQLAEEMDWLHQRMAGSEMFQNTAEVGVWLPGTTRTPNVSGAVPHLSYVHAGRGVARDYAYTLTVELFELEGPAFMRRYGELMEQLSNGTFRHVPAPRGWRPGMPPMETP